jgi:hypothetical protein
MTEPESGSNPATSSNLLTVDDLMEIITKAQAAGVEPISSGMRILSGLGVDVAVSGAVLKQALGDSKIVLEESLRDLLESVELIAKNASNVTLTNVKQIEVKVSGTPVKFKTQVTFTIGMDGNNLTLSNISGVEVHKLLWFDIKQIQVREIQGQKVLSVVTSGGTRTFPLA